MLLRFDAGLSRSIFAEAQKAADLVTQFRHRLEIWDLGSACHIAHRYNRSTIYYAGTTRVKDGGNYFSELSVPGAARYIEFLWLDCEHAGNDRSETTASPPTQVVSQKWLWSKDDGLVDFAKVFH
jgi:hypothetical protein